jgi:glycosyltransferase involved in cell wall biosynthesis
MKIGIEAQRLYRKKKAGMDIVVWELIRNLQRMDTENEYVIFVKPDEDPCLEETSNFKIVEVPGGNYLSWEQRSLPQAVKEAGVELLHCTSNTAPFFCPVPLVLTLHDIIFLEKLAIKDKGTRYQQLGKIYRKFLVPRIVKKCEKVITVSKQEKDRILKRFKLPATQVQVVYNGVGDEFQPVTDENLLQEVKAAYQLPEQFVLFLGNKDPKKNMKGVLEAFARFAETHEGIPLVVTAIQEEVMQELLLEIGREALIDRIILPGFAPFAWLPALYTLATVYMYPSFREGFGLPILEAFGCGTAVITANTSSMPEVAGDAAILVDPANLDEMATAIGALMDDKSLREHKIQQGFERVKTFSWEKMAREVLHLYKTVLAPEQLAEVKH